MKARSPPSSRKIMNPEAPFYRLPPEIWERVAAFVARSDLAAFTLASVKTYPHANPRLYSQIEISFCRCSEKYLECLSRTLTTNDELSSFVKRLLIDLTVPPHVKPATSRDDGSGLSKWNSKMKGGGMDKLLQLRGFGGRVPLSIPTTPSEWNRVAIQSLKGGHVEKIIPSLSSLSSITLILGKGRSDIDAQTVYAIFAKTAPNVLANLQSLTMQDQTISLSVSLRSLNSLRELDLSYTSMPGSDLTELLQANRQSLERLTLSFFVESRQLPIFRQSSGISLPNLQALIFEGPQPIAGTELVQLLTDSINLSELRVASLDLPSALEWGEVISRLSLQGNMSGMKHVAFGAPVSCNMFWEAVGQFLLNCGDQLQSLMINGSPRGPNVNMPDALRNALFRDILPQPVLTKLILMWRGRCGIEKEDISVIPRKWPRVELLHVCTPFTEDMDGFVERIKDLRALTSLYLVHPLRDGLIVSPDVSVIEESPVTRRMKDALCESSSPFVMSYIELAAKTFPRLNSISWALFEQDYRVSGSSLPSLFFKIRRSKESHHLENVGVQIAQEDKGVFKSRMYYCNVGNIKAILPQPPGLRETMGQRFREGAEKVVCPYAEFLLPPAAVPFAYNSATAQHP